MRNNILKFSMTLMIIISVAVAALAFINTKTKPLILAQKEKERRDAVMFVLPEGTQSFEYVGDKELPYFIGYSSESEKTISGYAILAKGKGYSSTVETMVGVNTDFIISGTKVTSQQETPGLGTKIKELGRYRGKKQIWVDQFIGKNKSNIFLDKMNPKAEEPIESVTGATISSKAVTVSIIEVLKELENKINK